MSEAMRQALKRPMTFEAKMQLVELLCEPPRDEEGNPQLDGWEPPSAEAIRAILEAGDVER